VIVCYLLLLATAARDPDSVKNAKNKENTQKSIHRFDTTQNPGTSTRPSGQLKNPPYA
jgi:hypothetical protein